MARKTEDEWRAELSADRYRVLREGGTEPPGSGKLLHEKREGVYVCGGCGAELFASDEKYESGSGWPSFTAPVDSAAINEVADTSHGMRRVEVRCHACEGHLGHVFDDGPPPTGERYCINSVALTFTAQSAA